MTSKKSIISKTAIIYPNVVIGEGTSIGDNVIVYPNTVIGNDTFIGANCILGENNSNGSIASEKLEIGSHSIIRSNTIIYSGCKIKDYFQTGHFVTIREVTKIGHHVSIGTYGDIQGNCKMGNYVRIHSNVFIPKKTEIHDFVWIFPRVLIANDPTPPSKYEVETVIDSFAVISADSTILPGVHIESDSLVIAKSNVTKNVLKRSVVGGNPAKMIKRIDTVMNHTTNEFAYPWRYHFDRNMPWVHSDYDTWIKSLSNIQLAYYFEFLEDIDFIPNQ